MASVSENVASEHDYHASRVKRSGSATSAPSHGGAEKVGAHAKGRPHRRTRSQMQADNIAMILPLLGKEATPRQRKGAKSALWEDIGPCDGVLVWRRPQPLSSEDALTPATRSQSTGSARSSRWTWGVVSQKNDDPPNVLVQVDNQGSVKTIPKSLIGKALKVVPAKLLMPKERASQKSEDAADRRAPRRRHQRSKTSGLGELLCVTGPTEPKVSSAKEFAEETSKTSPSRLFDASSDSVAILSDIEHAHSTLLSALHELKKSIDIGPPGERESTLPTDKMDSQPKAEPESTAAPVPTSESSRQQSTVSLGSMQDSAILSRRMAENSV